MKQKKKKEQTNKQTNRQIHAHSYVFIYSAIDDHDNNNTIITVHFP